MTVLRFHRSQGRLTGFTCQGHSGYAEAGADIVCAAVTSALRLTECLINDVYHADAAVCVDDRTPEITLTLRSPHRASERVLEGFLLYMRELSNENPNHLTVLEV